MMSARPPNAPTGRPPPMTLPSVVRSGGMPSTFLDARRARRESRSSPHRRSAARRCSVHSSRKSLPRNPGSGSTRPMLPTYGSTITAAIDRAFAANAASTASEVVVADDDRVARGAFGDAGRVGHAVGQRARAGRDQERIAVTVVAAGELHDLRAAREAARQPHRAHRRFGAARDEAHALDRRHHRDDEFRQFAFGFGRRAERRAARRGVARSARRRPDARGRASAAPTTSRSRCSRGRRRRTSVAPDPLFMKTGEPPTAPERAHRRVHAAGNNASSRARTRRSNVRNSSLTRCAAQVVAAC